MADLHPAYPKEASPIDADTHPPRNFPTMDRAPLPAGGYQSPATIERGEQTSNQDQVKAYTKSPSELRKTNTEPAWEYLPAK